MDSIQKKVKKIITLQQDKADCGIAALRMIIRWHGADVPAERLRMESGTTDSGTSLLGLYQAAAKFHFNADAYQMEIHDLETVQEPCILHTLIDRRQLHYMVFFGFNKHGLAILGDPATGLRTLAQEDLEQIWISKTALLLTPGEGFRKTAKTKHVKSFRWILETTRENIPHLVVSIAVGMSISILSLSTSVFFQKLIDSFLPHGRKELVAYGLGLLFTILAARSLLSYLRQFILFEFSKNYNRKVTVGFLEKMLNLSKYFYDSRKIGDLIARINDTQKIQNNINFIVGNIIIDALIIMVSLAALFIYSWLIGSLMLVFIPLTLLILYSYNTKLASGQKQVMGDYAELESYYINTLSGLDTIKEFGKSNYFLNIGAQIFSKYQESAFQLNQTGNKLALKVDLLICLQTVTTIGFGAFTFFQGNITIGEVVACLSILTSSVPSILRIAQINIHLQEMGIALNRILEVTEDNPPQDKKEKVILNDDAQFGMLRVDNVSFAYPGRQNIFSGVDITINRGDCVVILGPNGSGKSTLLKLLSGMHRPSSGKISINIGAGTYDINDLFVNQVIATVPQTIHIFQGNIYDNIVLGSGKSRDAFEPFMTKYGFDKYFELFPLGYLTPISEDAIKLSGGQLQILALARALYSDPKLLILDECTSFLDAQSESFMLSLLQYVQKNEDKTIICVSHDNKIIQLANKRFYLEENRTICITDLAGEIIN